METMKAVRFSRYGGAEVLDYCTVERPAAGPGEILLKVLAAGVNPADYKFRAGALAGHRPKVLPVVPGMDVAGVVAACGPGVERLAVGDAVFGMLPPSRLGGYAEYVAASSGFFAPIPDGLSSHAAAALATAALTGVELVEDDLGIRSGQRLLVIGALGAVGRAAVFAGRRRGAHVTAAVRRGRLDEVTFADEVIDAGTPCAAQFDGIADTVGGETALSFIGNLRAGGVLSSVSTVRIPGQPRSDVVVRSFVCYPDPQRLGDLARAVISGEQLLQEIQSLKLADVAEAHRRLESGGSIKFVLIP
ncbi:MAG: hypothetical protein BGP06_09845 [Rhizobiales bacterium 65-9]|nr:MAG: hypothetical protein BGP06_09845 [Rhizobiales bacterium 65-9]